MIAAPLPVIVRVDGLLRWFSFLCGMSSGRRVLDWVEAPKGLQYAPEARTRRLMRSARISAW
jgi:hypothetical protein